MSTTLDTKSKMSQRADTAIRSAGSTSITRLPGKGSKSIIPRSLTPARNISAGGLGDEMREGVEVGSKPEGTTPQIEGLNPGDEAARSRVSGLPTLTVGSRRGVAKNGVNSAGSISGKPRPGVTSTLQKRQLENQFSTKRHKYITVKKELGEKQKQASDLYDDVVDLREKLIAAGLKDPGKIERLIFHSKIDPRESGSFCEAGSRERLPRYDTGSVFSGDFIGTFELKLNEIPNVCLNLCREALIKRTEIVAWICDLNGKNPDPEITRELEIHEKDEEGFESRVESAADKHEAVINELVKNVTTLWGEHEDYRTRIKEIEKCGEGAIRDLEEKLAASGEDLDLEREKYAQLKERKNQAESQLQKARSRIRDFENHASSNEAKMNQLQGAVKTLENQMRQKEATMEARTKEMQKSMKNGESLVSKTEKQRDSLESRVNELKKKIDSKEKEFNERVKNLSKQLEETNNELSNEKDSKNSAEEKVKELSERCAKLEEKSQQLCDLAEKRKDLSVKPVDGKHTDNEIQLWNDLREARSMLEAKEEKLVQIQREKRDIISVIQQAADRENPASGKDKLAADLVTKTEELQAATKEREEVQNNLKTALERSENFERQLSELQGRLHAQSKEGGKTGWGAYAIELQQQLCDLRTTLTDLTRNNEELETALTQKQLELEQRDRIMREQSKVLKVRDELIGLLKGQSAPNTKGELTGLQNGAEDQQMQFEPETISKLVNKQIAAKAEDLQSLYSTLESKQMQLMRLEKVVRQMEDDNDRSQATRTKLEREVAQLRLKLHEKNRVDNRSTGFTFM